MLLQFTSACRTLRHTQFVEVAMAGADPQQRDALSIGQALTYIRAGRGRPSIQTLRRRLARWQAGERGAEAVKGSRTSGDRGHWRVDPVDVQRVRRQNLGLLPGDVTAEQFAAGVAEGLYRLDED